MEGCEIMGEMHIYYAKKQKRKKTKEELRAEELRSQLRINQIKSKYKSVGIYSKRRQKALSCLLYRFKKCNPYYSMLVEIYLRDNTKEDFFNMCYMIAYENDPEDFKTMYMELQKQIEIETAVTRKVKAKQVYKPLSIEEMRENGKEVQADSIIDKLEKELDLVILFDYLENHASKSQVKAIKEYLETGKKIDSRQKRRIKERLDNIDFKLLLY